MIMKKIFGLLAFASMLITFAACEKKGVDEEKNPTEGVVELSASFKACATRVSLNNTTLTWEAGDQIVVNNTTFTTKDGGAKAKFTAPSFEVAEGATLVARYGESKIAKEQTAREGSVPAATPAVAVAMYSKGVELSFGSVASFLKFTPSVAGDVTIATTDGKLLAGDFSVDAEGKVAFATTGSTSVTLKGCAAGKSYYVAVAPVKLSSSLVITIGGKSYVAQNNHLEFVANTIYNLGKLSEEGGNEQPDQPNQPAGPKQSHNLYLYKHKNTWSSVKLYSWDAAEAKYTGEWPGEDPAREEMINGHKYLVWEMPAEADGVELSIVVNNGVAEGGEKSEDFSLGKFDGERYILLNGTKLSNIADKRDPIPAGDSEDPNTPDVPVGNGHKIYVYQHNNSWSLNLYTWDENGTAYTGEWPGSSTSITEKIGDYEYKVWVLPETANNVNLSLLLNGGGDDSKTGDFSLGVFDGDHYLLLSGSAISEITDSANPGVPVQPENPGQPELPTNPDVYAGWGLVGEHQGWDITSPSPLYKTTTENLYVAENVELKANGFKFAKYDLQNWDGENTTFGAWKRSEGKEYFDYNAEISSGEWYSVYDNNLGEHKENIGVGDWSKRYDIYLRVVEHAEWGEHLEYTVVEHGADVNAPDNGGNEGTPETPETPNQPELSDKVVYLKPNSNWVVDNARFAAYFFVDDSKHEWVSLTDEDSDSIYECHLPVGYELGCNIIFCRMNPSSTVNSWDNKWNQTADLTTPTDGKNLYTVADGSWDGSDNNQWSVK